jgi:hypothetical protein
MMHEVKRADVKGQTSCDYDTFSYDRCLLGFQGVYIFPFTVQSFCSDLLFTPRAPRSARPLIVLQQHRVPS